MPLTVHTSIKLSGPQHDYLRREAERLGISVADLIRRIIDAYREGRATA